MFYLPNKQAKAGTCLLKTAYILKNIVEINTRNVYPIID
jgi:hypothetical protein